MAALQQPSMDNLAAGLHTISNELVLFQNIPAVAEGQRLHHAIQKLQDSMNNRFNDVMRQLQAQQEQLTRQQEQMRQLQEGVNGVRAELDLQPMRLYNSSASFNGTYMGPNERLPNLYPNNRDALGAATGQQCIALSSYLGLPPLPNNATVQQRKDQITKYLGVAKFV
ncbi:hypothetical protein L210DRAFT_3653235 [Boletus edulis BED1]|uniref:Uncharacterized protein n=1 Tax=Boletus edulis BED1 TaxID=1328754 RepID=A0AAD4BF89_BOLED|nr:hypothetical protein L210DRAFT_3653235 [Boletus edulis BED1]